jgi:hypothetical protein
MIAPAGYASKAVIVKLDKVIEILQPCLSQNGYGNNKNIIDSNY